MNKQSEQIRKTCVWWICTLVALIPIVAVVWIVYMTFS